MLPAWPVHTGSMTGDAVECVCVDMSEVHGFDHILWGEVSHSREGA